MTKRRDEGVEVGKTNGDAVRSDALVLFGVTGDLAHKMIFPALYAMAKRVAQTEFWPQQNLSLFVAYDGCA
jgi:hypothetical protein